MSPCAQKGFLSLSLRKRSHRKEPTPACCGMPAHCSYKSTYTTNGCTAGSRTTPPLPPPQLILDEPLILIIFFTDLSSFSRLIPPRLFSQLLCIDIGKRVSCLAELQKLDLMSQVNWDAVLSKNLRPGFIPNVSMCSALPPAGCSAATEPGGHYCRLLQGRERVGQSSGATGNHDNHAADTHTHTSMCLFEWVHV